jgi:excisionase family DNA binding protein
MEKRQILDTNISLSATEFKDVLFKAVEQNISTVTVAEILGISTKTVFNMSKDGRLTPVNPGSSKSLFKLSKVLEYKLLHK